MVDGPNMHWTLTQEINIVRLFIYYDIYASEKM